MSFSRMTALNEVSVGVNIHALLRYRFKKGDCGGSLDILDLWSRWLVDLSCVMGEFYAIRNRVESKCCNSWFG